MARTCFVVMGFHRKTDFPTGRVLDLDKSYRLLVKPVVEACGLQCVRADEIVHAGVIDVPMYQHLLESELVIADLSTANPNAFYELGVRHALRPFSTIVIAESRLQYPFDVAHTTIRSYQHLGDAIDYEEVLRFRGELEHAISTILTKQEKDSPVYTYLPALSPPGLIGGRRGRGAGVRRSAAEDVAVGPTPAALVEHADRAIRSGDFLTAKTLLSEARAMRPADRPSTSNDDYLVQRLALATAKSLNPDAHAALTEARRLLQMLQPSASRDPAVITLWADIERDLWYATRQPAHLDEALLAYERAFWIGDSAGSGLEHAFLLNIRAARSGTADAVADFVQARRVRRRVIEICEPGADAASSLPDDADESVVEAGYRVRAGLAEAWLGVDDSARAERWRAAAFALPARPDWRELTDQRLSDLRALISQSPLRTLTS